MCDMWLEMFVLNLILIHRFLHLLNVLEYEKINFFILAKKKILEMGKMLYITQEKVSNTPSQSRVF